MNGNEITPGVSAPKTILIVDDTPENLRLLLELLKQQGYKVRAVPNGRLALQAAASEPPDLILLDIMMPEMDGYEVCRRLKQDVTLCEIPVLFLSALGETLDKVRAFDVGAVDYVTKPFQFEEVRARVETHLRLRRLQVQLEAHNRQLQDRVEDQVREISDSQMATIVALARLAESRDKGTGKHIERVQIYCRLLAGQLREHPSRRDKVDEAFVENIFRASPLHDIGKVAIRDSILLKPGPLTPEEFDEMKSHTTLGAETLQEVQKAYPKNGFVRLGIEIARSHHERWDGTGYPHGLAGTAIPLSARIMAVADSYDAARSRRFYKPPLPHAECCSAIYRRSGSYLDPVLVEAFRALEARFSSVADSLDE
jgi:putative two-component system response regulator